MNNLYNIKNNKNYKLYVLIFYLILFIFVAATIVLLVFSVKEIVDYMEKYQLHWKNKESNPKAKITKACVLSCITIFLVFIDIAIFYIGDLLFKRNKNNTSNNDKEESYIAIESTDNDIENKEVEEVDEEKSSE